jgi:ectoine hydroxylase-related dioxygenase (phytanoyl-CoA dioxygenase family)
MHNAQVLHFDRIVTEINDLGFCVLRAHLRSSLVDACREAFWPTLQQYVEANADRPNRGPQRHFLPMPWDVNCYAPEFFFDSEVLSVVRGLMGDRAVADQWGCDVLLEGSCFQQFHADYQRPLFAEQPDLLLPHYMLAMSFGLVPITAENGAVEIVPCTHRIARNEALQQTASRILTPRTVPLEIGDILLRHPWALHRGTPNNTPTPRPLVTFRYVRRWYADDSREVNPIPAALWRTMTLEQQSMMRFPLAGN